MTEYSQPTAFARGIFEERTDGEGAGAVGTEKRANWVDLAEWRECGEGCAMSEGVEEGDWEIVLWFVGGCPVLFMFCLCIQIICHILWIYRKVRALRFGWNIRISVHIM